MSNSGTFSYAQAARGKSTTAQATPPQVSSPAPPSTSSLGKDDAVSTTTTATALSSQPASEIIEDKPASTESDAAPQKQDTDVASVGETASSAAPAADQPSATVSRDDATSTTGSLAASSEKPAKTASPNSRQDSNDSRKGKKGKKGKHADKDSEQDQAQQKEAEKEAVKIALKEAPAPTVNPWHKRIEAQSAQAKSVAGQAPKAAAAATEGATASAQEGKKQGAESPDASAAVKTQKRTGDAPRPGEQRRSGPRGSRSDKDDRTSAALPSVEDAAAWPTPETAATADEGKPKATAQETERTEKESQDDNSQAKSKQKWVPVPFVPTVAFQTPLPQRTAKPRGGGRGGREVSSRGAQGSPTAATGEKVNAASPTTTAPAKTSEGRETQRESASTGRASSQGAPAPSKRASIDGSFAREQRKPSATTSTERAKDPATTEGSALAGKSDSNTRGKCYNTHTTLFQKMEHISPSQRLGEVSGYGADYREDAGFQSFKEQGHSGRERSDVRHERGGRGGYRGGRGGHNGHAAASHINQAGFPPNGQRYSSHAVYSPQQQNPYSPPPGQYAFSGHSSRNGRGNARSQSLTNGPSYSGRAANGGNNAQRAHSLQTSELPQEYQMHGYNGFSQFPSPFQDPDLIHGLKLQVEYYFSLDNLCKDTFLRKNMDSQGFVLLSTVASFQRMAALAPSLDFVRLACAQSEKIDYVVGDDNVERLRSREKWEMFLMPMDERDQGARSAGPAHFQWRSHDRIPQAPYPAQMIPSAYPAVSPTGYAQHYGQNGTDQMYSFYPNGMHAEPNVNGGAVNGFHYPGESQLSATVADFAPSGFAGPTVTLDDFQNWSDEQVDSFMVNLSDERAQSASEEKGNPAVVNGSKESSSNASNTEQSKEAPRTNSVSYTKLRSRALEQRKAAAPGETPPEMRDLYAFWSHALTEHFNARMYQEFKDFALEDGRKETPSKTGLNRLMSYYHKILGQERSWAAGKPFHEFFTPHYEEAKQVAQSMGVVNGEGRN